MIVRPTVDRKTFFREAIHLLPMTIAYCFTFFSLHRELKGLRWGNITRYWLVGLGLIISLWCSWAVVGFRVFYYFFTGMWEWGNKVTEKCRGAKPTVIVNL